MAKVAFSEGEARVLNRDPVEGAGIGNTHGPEVAYVVTAQDVPDAVKNIHDAIQAEMQGWERDNAEYLSTLSADSQVAARETAFRGIADHYGPVWPVMESQISALVNASQKAANVARYPLRMQGSEVQKAQGSTEYSVGVTLASQGIRAATASLDSALRERAIDRASAIVATLPNLNEKDVTPDARARWDAAVARYNAVTGAHVADRALAESESALTMFKTVERAVMSGQSSTQILMVIGAAALINRDPYSYKNVGKK